MHLYIRQMHRTLAALVQFEEILVDTGLHAQKTKVERMQNTQTLRYRHDFLEIKENNEEEDILLSLWLVPLLR